jgi:hypothetical protein
MGLFMHKMFGLRLFRTALAVILTLGVSTAVHADNVPGSAKEATGYITAAASDTLINGIQSDVRKLRGDDRPNVGLTFLDPQVVSEDGMTRSFLAEGMATTEGGVSVIGSLAYRNIDEPGVLDYDLFVGSLLVGYHMNDRTLIFGGLTAESGDGSTPPDDGTISHSAFGGVVGVDYAINDKAFMTFIAGKMALDYDISRSGGAITASFGADRTYVSFSGEYRLDAATTSSVLTAGLRYVEQSDEGYTESGGAIVDPATGKTFSAVFGVRTTFTEMGGFQPFVEADLRYDLSQDMVPYVVDNLPDGRTHARLGVGVSRDTGTSTFEAGIGGNFGEDGYNGLDANLRLTLRF